MGGDGLANGTDIVPLAFDSEQAGAANGTGVDPMAAIAQLAFGQAIFLEPPLDGL